MTSVFMTSSINSVNYNNFHGYSNYGLNYFNDSASEFSDEYQNSTSPVSSPVYNVQCHMNIQYNGYYEQNMTRNHQNNNSTFYQQPSPINKIEECQKFNNCRQETIKDHHRAISRCQSVEKNSGEVKSVVVVPEILKRRRVAANARERKRMNNLNYAFDR